MTGVYDTKEMFCKKCNKDTLHETGWESEDPDRLDIECTICKTRTIV